MKIDLTNLTAHPDWVQVAALFEFMENGYIRQLKTKEDPNANRFLIVLNQVRSEISKRTTTPNIWKVHHERLPE